MTGGGIIHLLKQMPPYAAEDEGPHAGPRLFSLGEYAAGYVPLGYFLATGRVACAVATTGAASKPLGCGLRDAKLHDIASVYIVPVSPSARHGYGPLQDTSFYGGRLIGQLSAEMPQSVIRLDQEGALAERLETARATAVNADEDQPDTR